MKIQQKKSEDKLLTISKKKCQHIYNNISGYIIDQLRNKIKILN